MDQQVQHDTQIILDALASMRKHRVQHQRTRFIAITVVVVGSFVGLHHVHIELIEELGNLPLHAFLGVAIDKILFGLE